MLALLATDQHSWRPTLALNSSCMPHGDGRAAEDNACTGHAAKVLLQQLV